MDPEPIIELSGVRKVFRRGKEVVEALKGVDFTVHRSEYLSIMGPSGSGKSTLFNMIGALDRPTSGMVRVAGHDLARLPARQLAYFRSHYIGYVFQSYNLIFAYDVVDNVAMPLIFSGVEPGEARERARTVLGQVGLQHRLEHRPGELSGGQQQRVAIARALVGSPLIVLADEPTANLDLDTGEEIIDLLSTLCSERGVTIVSATHDHKMLARSDRILWIRDGSVDRIQTAAEAGVQLGSLRPH